MTFEGSVKYRILLSNRKRKCSHTGNSRSVSEMKSVNLVESLKSFILGNALLMPGNAGNWLLRICNLVFRPRYDIVY